jgi:hypothetical protein
MKCLEQQSWNYKHEINKSSSLRAFSVDTSCLHLIVLRYQDASNYKHCMNYGYISISDAYQCFSVLLFPWNYDKILPSMGMIKLEKGMSHNKQKIKHPIIPSILQYMSDLQYPFLDELKEIVKKRCLRLFHQELFQKALHPHRLSRFLEQGGNYEHWY